MVWIEREERDIEIFKFKQNQVGPQIYIYIYIYQKNAAPKIEKASSRYREKNSINREVSRYRQKKVIDRSRRYRASIEQTKTLKNWLDGSSYLSRGIENKPRNLNRRDMYQGAIKLLSRRYRASIKKPETRFFNGKNNKK